MSDEERMELKKLAEQQEAILTAIGRIEERLAAGEERRMCLWSFKRTKRQVQKLRTLFPDWEQNFSELIETLGSYAIVRFDSEQDLKAVHSCFLLINQMLIEEEQKATRSIADLFRSVYSLIKDLETLESGEPPGLSAAEYLRRDLWPELKETERAAVRERFQQRMDASIDRIFERREAEIGED